MILKNRSYQILPSIILIIILLIIINSPYKVWPAHDEIVSISTFLDIRSLFLKYIPNNHTITGFIGFIITSLIGLNIFYLRLISFFFFIIIILKVGEREKNNFIPLVLLAIYLSYDTLSDYSFLFRGYYFLSLGFVIIFYLLKKNENQNNIKYAYFISSLLLIHNLGSVYFLLPIILFSLIQNFKNKNFKIIYFLIFPASIYYMLAVPVTGFYVNKDLLFNFVNEKNYFEIFYFIPKIYLDGFKEIIFPKILENSETLILNYEVFFNSFYYNKILLLILFFSFLKSLIFIFKQKRLIDFVIFSLFIMFIIINKIPPERLLISYVFVLAIYLLSDFDYSKKKFIKFYISIKILLLVFIFFKTINFQILSSNEINLIEKKSNFMIEEKCILKLNSINQFDYHYFYYVYLTKCNKKPNIIEFYNFYKTRIT